MLRMMTSDLITYSHYKLRHVIFTYALAFTKEHNAIYGSCLISSHRSPEGREEDVGLFILSGNKQTGRNSQAFSGIRKELSKGSHGHQSL